MQIKCIKPSKNEDCSLNNHNVSLHWEEHFRADQKPSAPALKLILGNYLKHVTHLSFYFPSNRGHRGANKLVVLSWLQINEQSANIVLSLFHQL